MSAGLSSPPPPDLRRGLRAEVWGLKTEFGRRRFLPIVTLGIPGAGTAAARVSHVLESEAADDLALRADIVAAMLHRIGGPTPDPVCWVSRPGKPTMHDLDAGWLAAAMAAYAEAAVPLTLVVLTTTGWFDPRSGVGQTWRRLRQR